MVSALVPPKAWPGWELSRTQRPETMNRQAVKQVSFIARRPRDRQELRTILELAGRLGEKFGRASAEEPDNVIPFPTREEPLRRRG